MTDKLSSIGVKPNWPVPRPVKNVERQVGAVRADNESGGEVDRGRYVTLPPVRRTA